MGRDSGAAFVLNAAETYGRLGQQATRFLSELADIAAKGSVRKSSFVRMAHTELSCALVKRMGKVCSASVHETVRAAGRGFLEGSAVPVAETVCE